MRSGEEEEEEEGAVALGEAAASAERVATLLRVEEEAEAAVRVFCLSGAVYCRALVRGLSEARVSRLWGGWCGVTSTSHARTSQGGGRRWFCVLHARTERISAVYKRGVGLLPNACLVGQNMIRSVGS